MPVANDFYNNYVNTTEDNCFELDGSMHNMRAMRNLCFNHAGPADEQPAYLRRTNVLYPECCVQLRDRFYKMGSGAGVVLFSQHIHTPGSVV